ncbi:MAG: hypothetical protein HeimC3_08210 [Candidatus Heimdallarchaeota archaeon LC_3]|nr:MAG: hypothetical protein HeimC3_08210 [Candidatus Heimdallarchaeota archaeon LC_3]
MLNCSICENEITRDRYNIALRIERQNIALNEQWNESWELPRENLCDNCFDKILGYLQAILNNLRINKGKIVK